MGDFTSLHTREEHVAWCKERTRPYAEAADTGLTLSSLLSDFGKHDETRDLASVVAELGGRLAVAGHLSTAAQLRSFIDDFR